jgi:DUF971 family protein
MPKAPKVTISSIQPVGRYALGVSWGDRHESIYPFSNLRKLCPCDECRGTPPPGADEPGCRLEHLHRVVDASVLLTWGDGHETLFLVEELREICGCALCKGEPNYPITGQIYRIDGGAWM